MQQTMTTMTMTTMTPAEATQFGIPQKERESYFRVDTVGGSRPPGSRSVTWFRWVPVDLGDGGDPVPIAEPWDPEL
jgi:hypothetical protein